MAAPTRPWCVVPQPRGATSTAGRPSSADPLLVPAPRRGTRSAGIATRTDCARALGATIGRRCLRPIRRRPYRPVRLVGHPWQRGSLVVVVAVTIVAIACAATTVTASLARPIAFPSARLPTCRYVLPLTRPSARLPMRPPAHPAALAHPAYRQHPSNRPPACTSLGQLARSPAPPPSRPLSGCCVCVCVLACVCARVRSITLVFRCLRACVRARVVPRVLFVQRRVYAYVCMCVTLCCACRRCAQARACERLHLGVGVRLCVCELGWYLTPCVCIGVYVRVCECVCVEAGVAPPSHIHRPMASGGATAGGGAPPAIGVAIA